jgi:ketosteroid isomerase-like protein
MATIWELADGRIHRERDYWDAATLLAQIGVLPGAATPAP